MSDERTQRLLTPDAAHVWHPLRQKQPCRLRVPIAPAHTDGDVDRRFEGLDAMLARTPALVEQEAR